MGIKYVVRYAFFAPSVQAHINNDTVDALAARMDPQALEDAIAKGFIIPQVLPEAPASSSEPPQMFGEGIPGASRVEGAPVNLLAPSLEETAAWRTAATKQAERDAHRALDDQGEDWHPRRRSTDQQATSTDGGD